MKKNTRKFLSLVLGMAMTTQIFAGCGSEKAKEPEESSTNTNVESEEIKDETTESASETGTPDISEHVDLTMYLVGDTPETYDDIIAKVNEITEREINASLEVKWLSWSEYDSKYSLLFSGKEDFDVIYTASGWCHYEQTVALGGFMELTEDLLSTYMPDVWEQLPETAWNQAKIDGKVYMVPANFVEVNPTTIAVRTDWLKEFGMNDIGSWDDLVAFMKACGENGKNAFAVKEDNPWTMYTKNTPYCNLGGNGFIYYNGYDAEDGQLISLFDMEEFRDYCHQMKEVADAGAIPGDVLSASIEERQNYIANGKAGFCLWNVGTCKVIANEINAAHPECEMQIFEFAEDNTYIATPYTSNAMAINANSKNPERAMMLLNLLATNQEIMDLTILGIQGVNWEFNDDGTYSVLQPYNASNYWGWRNRNLLRTPYNPAATDVDVKYEQMMERFYESLKPEHALDCFSFDTTPVSTQVAAVDAAGGTYWYPLVCGLVDDVDATIEQYKTAMETAGLQDIIDEAQRQVDAYMASQK